MRLPLEYVDLPEATRSVLLVAALNDEDGIGEILAARAAITGALWISMPSHPAAAAGIVDADLQTIRFRHPLIRSASPRSSDLAGAPAGTRGTRETC